jgi:hypothetical protein
MIGAFSKFQKVLSDGPIRVTHCGVGGGGGKEEENLWLAPQLIKIINMYCNRC